MDEGAQNGGGSSGVGGAGSTGGGSGSIGSTERGGTWIDWPQAVIQVQDPSAWESVMSVNPVVFIWWQVVHTAPQLDAVLGPSGYSCVVHL